MIEDITEINGSKIIASRELKNSNGLNEVQCEDMTIHTIDGEIDNELPSIERMSLRIEITRQIIPSDIQFT